MGETRKDLQGRTGIASNLGSRPAVRTRVWFRRINPILLGATKRKRTSRRYHRKEPEDGHRQKPPQRGKEGGEGEKKERKTMGHR